MFQFSARSTTPRWYNILFYQWIPWSHDHGCTHTTPSVWCKLSVQMQFYVHYIPVERIFQKIVLLVHNLWVIKTFNTHDSSSFCGWTFGPSVQNVDFNSPIFYHHDNFICMPILPVWRRQWWWLTRIYWPSHLLILLMPLVFWWPLMYVTKFYTLCVQS